MKKTYRSRISVLLVVIIAAVCFTPLLFIHEIGFAAIEILVFLCVLMAFYSIKYVIDGQTLKIYYFCGIHQDIDIHAISKMEPSRCILSSPAASLKRLAIYYGNNDVVYISPRKQDDFIKEIMQIK